MEYRNLVKTVGNFNGPLEATFILLSWPGISERAGNLPDIPSGALT
jgi:hypothetical protein